MAKVLHFYVHPGNQFSVANRAIYAASRGVEGISQVDLYATYPRAQIDIDAEQARLLAHDVIVFQFPVYWYSCPSLMKEWIDLVLEHGFAYGAGGDKLAGKTLMLAVTTAGDKEAYQEAGYQHYPLRTFLTPFEQTARLCKMRFLAPYTLYAALKAQEDGRIAPHAAGFAQLLEGLRDDRLDLDAAEAAETLFADTLPLTEEA